MPNKLVDSTQTFGDKSMFRVDDVMVTCWWDYSRMVLHIGFDKLLGDGKRTSYECAYGYTFMERVRVSDSEEPLKVIYGVEHLDLVCVCIGRMQDDTLAVTLSDAPHSRPFIVLPICWDWADNTIDGGQRLSEMCLDESWYNKGVGLSK